MNKKGQVLVVFIIFLPIFFMILSLAFDVGCLYIEKRNIDYNIEDILEYSLKNIDDDNTVLKSRIKKFLKLNINNIRELNIEIKDKVIEIKVVKNRKSIFSTILKSSEYKISSSYVGYIKNEEIIIERKRS